MLSYTNAAFISNWHFILWDPPFRSAPPTPNLYLLNHKTHLEKGPQPPDLAHHRLRTGSIQLGPGTCLVILVFAPHPPPGSFSQCNYYRPSHLNTHILAKYPSPFSPRVRQLWESALPLSSPSPTIILFFCLFPSLFPFLRPIALQHSSINLPLKSWSTSCLYLLFDF